MSRISPAVSQYEIFTFTCAILLFFCFVFPAQSQQQPKTLPTTTSEKKSGERDLAPAGTIAKLPASAKRWALVIGVDNYRDPQISGLRGAANDAKALARTLELYSGFPSDQIVLLATDQPEERQPTRVNILRRLSNLMSLVPKDGLILISFAGHGMERGGQAFLLPSDAQISDDISFLEDTAVNVARLRERVKNAGVGQVLILLDACRNDPGGRADEANNMTRGFANSFNFDVKNREVSAFATLYATAVGQRAYEYSEKKQGYFTWAVVEGLKGAAANERGEVTLAGLLKYVQESVPKRVAIDLGAGKNQKPFAVVEGYRAEDLIIAAGGAKTAQNETTNQETTPKKDTQANKETQTSNDDNGIKLVGKPGDWQAGIKDSGKNEFVSILDASLNAQTARVGDRFALRITSKGEYEGAVLEGRVARVEPPTKAANKAKLGLTFDKLRRRDGRSEKFSGMIVDVVFSNPDGFEISFEDEANGDKPVPIGSDGNKNSGTFRNPVSIIETDSGNLSIKAGTEFYVVPETGMTMLTTGTSTPQNVKDSSGLNGGWGLTLNTPAGPGFMILILTQRGEVLNGTIADYTTQSETAEIQNGKLTAGGFSFKAKMKGSDGKLATVVFVGKVNGDRMSGTISSPQGTMAFSGTKAVQ